MWPRNHPRRSLHCVTWLAVVAASSALAACSDPARRGLGALCTDDAACESGLCSFGLCLDPSVDEDHDGLTNGLEATLGANPFNPDSDYDGVPDGDEVDDDGAPDTDGDGLADILESQLRDADDDCLPDELDAETTTATDLAALVALRCEARGVCGAHGAAVRVRCDAHGAVTCLYDAVPGWQAFESTCDGLDNDCDGRADESHPDLDGDQVADCVDPDRDGDGAPDATDNCASLVNAGQDDADGDKIGDACDPPTAPLVKGFEPPSPGHVPEVHVLGAAEPFATVAVYRADLDGNAVGTAPIGSAIVPESGALDVLVVVAEGVQRFLLRATNRAGLTSVDVATDGRYTLDLASPAPPVLAGAAFIQASGPNGGKLRFFLDGTVEPSAAVTLHTEEACVDAPIGLVGGAQTANGHWFADTKIDADKKVVYAAAIDVAGNRSACAVLVPLEGDIVLEAFADGRLQGDATIQLHDAFGKPKALLATDTSGRVTATIRAGDGATAAFPIAGQELAWRWVSTLGLIPGGAARIGASFGDPAKGASEPLTPLQFHWPAAPNNAAQVCVHLLCGPDCVPVGSDTKSGTTLYVAPTCLVEGAPAMPTFVTTEGADGRPTRFAAATIDLSRGLGKETVISITAWRTDWVESDLVVSSEADASSFQVGMTLELGGYPYAMNQGALPQFGFTAPGADGAVAYLFPSVPGAAATWQLIAAHVSVGNGLGVRGLRGRAPSLPHTAEIAFDSDLLPRVFQSEVQWTDVRPRVPLSLTWGADPTLAEGSDVMSVSLTAHTPQMGSVNWTIFARATLRDTLAIPSFESAFPGVVSYVTSDDITVSGPTFFEAPAADGFEGFLICGGDPACLGGADGIIRWSSCCEQN